MANLPRTRKFGVETPKGTMIVDLPDCGKRQLRRSSGFPCSGWAAAR